MTGLAIVAGLALLAGGGELLVRGSVGVARRFGLSPFLIGAVLVGFGTSTPELLTSVTAAMVDSPGVAIGNVVGSNIANIWLILGLAALLSPIDAPAPRRDLVFLAAATVAGVLAIASGVVGHVEGGFLAAGLAIYVAASFWLDRRAGAADVTAATHSAEADAESAPARLPLATVFAIAGLVGVLIGARFLVWGAIAAASALGVADTVVGLTVVAVGTSMPELAVSVVAALRKQGGVALGNVLGSNIFNTLGVLGLTGLVHPLAAPANVIRVDIWVMTAATVGLIALSLRGGRIGRGIGIGFLLLYAAYTASLVVGLGRA